MNYKKELEKLVKQIENLPYSLERTRLLDEALRLAEKENDEQTQFMLRLDLMSSTANSGQFHIAFVHLTWCLNICDSKPNEFSIEHVLGSYENICQALGDYTSISYEQGLKQLEDLKTRLEKAGMGIRGYLKLFIHYQMDCGYDDKAKEAFDQLLAMQTDEYDYESTWELHSIVQYHTYFEELEQAEHKARLLLNAHLNGYPVPDYLFLSFAEINFAKKEEKLLEQYLEHHINFIDINARTLRVQSKYVYYQTFLGNTEKALSAFITAQKYFFDLIAEWYQFYFYCYNRTIFKYLYDTGKTEITAEFNEKWEFYREDNNYRTKELFDFLNIKCIETAHALDHKNGNKKYIFYQKKVLDSIDNQLNNLDKR
jgi:exonuclease VII small subunit